MVPLAGKADAFAGSLMQAPFAQDARPVRTPKGLDLGGLRQVGFAPMKPAPGDARLTPGQRNLKMAARELEAVFLNQLITLMRSTHVAKDPLAQGAGHDIVRSLMDTQISREMATRGSLGLADVIYRELLRGLPDQKARGPEEPERQGASETAKIQQDQGLAPSRP